jgi:hypothetical protein
VVMRTLAFLVLRRILGVVGHASSGIWTAVHLGQFASMAILLARLLTLFFALDGQAGTAR